MKKYSEPEIEIHKYSFVTGNVLTFDPSNPSGGTSGNNENDMGNGDDYDYFGNN